MDTKKVVLWGLGLAAVGGAIYWWKKKQQTVANSKPGTGMMAVLPATQPGNPATMSPVVTPPPMNS